MKSNYSKIILSTDRLLLRTWRAEDIALMTAISSDPVVMEHFPSLQDLKATQQLVQRLNEHYKKYGYTLYAIETKDTNEFIGFVGLDHPSFVIPDFISQGTPVVEIGWRLAKTFWGNGYATEAAKAVLTQAFTELHFCEVISFTAIANVKSRRVMEKIGMHHQETDDFDHPKLELNSPLRRHVLYRLSHDQFTNKG